MMSRKTISVCRPLWVGLFRSTHPLPHSKATVVDRRYEFIGSMNFDPRSVDINTEMGAFIDSPELAEALAKLIERDALPENSWRVGLDDEGELYWDNGDERVTRQPAQESWQRFFDMFFMMFP